MLILSANNTMLVIYIALMAVILLLMLMIVVGKAIDKKKAQKAIAVKANEPEVKKNSSETEKVAIAMALHLYYGVHDNESDVITLKRVQSRYSPWSSKIYGIQ